MRGIAPTNNSIFEVPACVRIFKSHEIREIREEQRELDSEKAELQLGLKEVMREIGELKKQQR